MKVSALVSPCPIEPDLGTTMSSTYESTRLTPRDQSESMLTEDSSGSSPRLGVEKPPSLTKKQAIRREQCRANQARYRNKQLNRIRQLHQENQRLEEEIQGLKLKKRSIKFERKTNQSPWTIVGELFRLLEDGFQAPWRLASLEEMMKHSETRQSLNFLQKSFVHDVAMGELRGIDALMDQWRRYSLYFEEPHLELLRVEAVTTGVVNAVATLSVTVTEFTLRNVLPHLTNPKRGKSKASSLRQQLVGQRLVCSCSLRLLFDAVSGRVVCLEPKIDLISPLLRLLKSIKDVSLVFQHTLITSECVVGDLPTTLRRGRK